MAVSALCWSDFRGRCSLAGPSAACRCRARAVLCAVLCGCLLLLRCCCAGAAVACACAPLLLVCTVSVVRRLRKPAGRLVFDGIRISTAGGRCLGLVLRGAGSVSVYYARHAGSVRSVHSVPSSAPKSIRQRHRRPGSSTVFFIVPPRVSAIKGYGFINQGNGILFFLLNFFIELRFPPKIDEAEKSGWVVSSGRPEKMLRAQFRSRGSGEYSRHPAKITHPGPRILDAPDPHRRLKPEAPPRPAPRGEEGRQLGPVPPLCARSWALFIIS